MFRPSLYDIPLGYEPATTHDRGEIINKGFGALERETVVSHIEKCEARHNAVNRFNTRTDVPTEWSFSRKAIHSIEGNCLYVNCDMCHDSEVYAGLPTADFAISISIQCPRTKYRFLSIWK